ncbi:hypothetical protein G195_002677 [Phytophthora kernoviae 00238/432]|uniref:Response regulatory domain-containing protein n=1 Tax=Phytophthora kernoviae 00238/432 TaxID=1284355 RepID=A0A8J4SNP2_9STRA|nr:hypothetical protein G195_002677 [Phytophthora kernoviae 00238/432]
MADRIYPVDTIAGDSWFAALQQADAAWVPLRENESGQSLIGYAQRIFDSRGGTVAYVLIRLSREDIVRRFADLPMVLDGQVLLVDTAGNVVMQMGDNNLELASDRAWIQEHVEHGEDGFEVVSGKPELMDQVKEESRAKREAQTGLLEAQIKPHFLYNTLDMIHWRALDYEAKDISRMIVQLSKLLRIGLSGGKLFIRVRDELEHARCYVSIQSERLPFSIDYQEHIDPLVRGCYIPKIILQPFIENAVMHGHPKEGKLRIQVDMQESESSNLPESKDSPTNLIIESPELTERGIQSMGYRPPRKYAHAPKIIIRIKDNGQGLPEDWKLEETSGIGIRNVHQRIQLYCGAGYGVDIRAGESGGVEVTITLPRIETEEQLNFWLDGLEVTQTLRRDHPHLPIIILSGYDEFENARAAMRWGVNHFLLKPAEVEEIESVLREVLLEQDVRERHEQLERTYKQEIGRVVPYLRKLFLHELLTTRYKEEELPAERMDYVGIRMPSQVKQYVEVHYAEEISFEGIAKGLFVHPKYLSQLFKRVTGENFVSYVNGYRIQRAMELLQSGHYMVYEVSEMTGFRNATYFSQVFKMLTGKSPSEVG